MIKKALTILVVLVLAMSMVACGGKGSKGGNGSSVSNGGGSSAGGPVVSADGVKFTFKPESAANKVFLAGSMNGWKPDSPQYALNDLDGDGVWEITVKLDPGSYKYKFVVDGNWTTDKANPKTAPDGYGGKNSVVEVK